MASPSRHRDFEGRLALGLNIEIRQDYYASFQVLIVAYLYPHHQLLIFRGIRVNQHSLHRSRLFGRTDRFPIVHGKSW